MEIDGLFLRIGATFDDVLKGFQNLEGQLVNQAAGLGSKLKTVGTNMTAALTLPLAALGTIGLSAFGDFEATMNRVGALTEATGDQMSTLNAIALDLGAKTQFSAKQAADAMAEFGAAGFATNEIISAMPGALALAAAGQLDMKRATEISASVLKGFGLEADKVGDVANIMAAAANKSAASVQDLGSSFKYIGPVASAVGMSLEETSAALALLANAGIKGESGGTAIRSMLASLLNPSKKAAEAMDELGINVKNASGNLLPMSEILDRLQPLQTATSEGFKIFGKRFSDVLPLLKAGSANFNELSQAMKQAGENKEAEKLASRLFTGWNASLESFKGSVETTMIKLGSVLAGPLSVILKNVLEPAMNMLGSLADWFGKLPQPIQTFAVSLGLIVAAAGPTIAAVGLIVTQFEKLAAVQAFTKGLEILKAGMMSFQGPAQSAAAAIKSLAAGFTEANLAKNAESIRSAMTGLGPAIVSAFQAIPTSLTSAKTALATFGSSAAGWISTNASALWAAAATMFAGIGPAITGALGSIGAVVSGAWASITAVITGFSWAGLTAGLSAAVSAITGAFSSLGALVVAGGPIALVVAAVAAVAGALYAVYKNWSDIKPVLVGIWQDIGNAVAAAGKWILGVLDSALGSGTVKTISGIWTSFRDWFGGLWTSIGNGMTAALRTMLGAAEAAASAIGAGNTAKALQLWIDKLDGIKTSAGAVATNFTTLANATTLASAAQAIHFTNIATSSKTAEAAMGAVSAHASTAAGHLERNATHSKGLAFNLEEARAKMDALRQAAAALADRDAFAALNASLDKFRASAADAATKVPDYITQIGNSALAAVKPFETAAQEIGDTVVGPTGIMPRLNAGLQSTTTYTKNAADSFGTFGRELQGAFGKFTSAIADGIVNWKGFGSSIISLAESIGKSLVKSLITDGLQLVGKELLNLDGSFKGLGQTIARVFGGGMGSGPGGPSEPGGPSGPASVVGSFSSVFGIVNGLAQTVTGVLSFLSGRRMEQDIGRIEVTTRGELNQLISIQGTLNQYLPNLQNTQQLIRLEGIENAVRQMAEGTGANLGQAIVDAIGGALQGFATMLQSGFQAMIDKIEYFRAQSYSQLSTLAQILIVMANSISKPENRMSLPSTTSQPLTQSGPSTTTQSTNRNSSTPPVTINVTSQGTSPTTFGQQVAQAFNANVAVRI